MADISEAISYADIRPISSATESSNSQKKANGKGLNIFVKRTKNFFGNIFANKPAISHKTIHPWATSNGPSSQDSFEFGKNTAILNERFSVGNISEFSEATTNHNSSFYSPSSTKPISVPGSRPDTASKLHKSRTQSSLKFNGQEQHDRPPKLKSAINWLSGESSWSKLSFRSDDGICGSESPEEIISKHKFNRSFCKQFLIQDILGEGGFGFVTSAVALIDGPNVRAGEQVAVKFILKERIPKSSYVKDDTSGLNIPNELYIIRQLNHPNIISFIDWFQDNLFFYMVTELHGCEWLNQESPQVSKKSLSAVSGLAGVRQVRRCAPMDLFECIEIHKRLSEELSRKVFHQVAQAIYYLHHEKGICHRDVKDENLVIDAEYRVKFIDFGAASYFLPLTSDNQMLSKPFIRQHKVSLFSKFHGTPQYCPPEIIKGQRYRGPEAEVWQMGVLLYTMLFGENPFNDYRNVVNDFVAIRSLINTCGCTVVYLDEAGNPQPSNSGSTEQNQSSSTGKIAGRKPVVTVSSQCIDLLESMLTRDPMRRITVQSIVKHPWFNNGI